MSVDLHEFTDDLKQMILQNIKIDDKISIDADEQLSSLEVLLIELNAYFNKCK